MNALQGAWARHGDVALVVIGALLVSAKGVIAKLLFRHGVAMESVLLLRAWVALPLVWAWGLRRVGWTRLASAPPRLIGGAMLAGISSYYVGAWFDFAALTMIDATLERVLLFSYPVMVVVARACGQRRWPDRRVVAAVCATYAGVICAVGGFTTAHWQANGLGALLVLGSAALFAYYLIANERVAASLGSVPFIVYAMSAAALAFAVHAQVYGGSDLAHLSGHAWALIAMMSIGTNALPLFLFSAAIARIGAQRAAIVSTIGPPATFALAWALLGEKLLPVQVLGTALILSGILILELGRTRRAAAAAQERPA